jgi:hypothetical protein
MLSGSFDEKYIAVCRQTVDDEAQLGFEGRARINCSASLYRRALEVLAREHRWSNSTFALRLRVLSQALFFDLATTSTFYLQRVAKAAAERRQMIDEAIGEFDGAIGQVIDAEVQRLCDGHPPPPLGRDIERVEAAAHTDTPDQIVGLDVTHEDGRAAAHVELEGEAKQPGAQTGAHDQARVYIIPLAASLSTLGVVANVSP